MSIYYFITDINKKTIYSGHFKSFAACAEDAHRNGVSLRYADFRFKPLTNVMLDDADLSHADFSGANLSGANLSDCIAPYAVFDGADLYNCCFACSDLRHARFFHASFGGTDFSGADISGCHFAGQSCLDIDFTRAKDMQDCLYLSHCSDSRTPYRFSSPPLIVKGLAETVLVSDPVMRNQILRIIHYKKNKKQL